MESHHQILSRIDVQKESTPLGAAVHSKLTLPREKALFRRPQSVGEFDGMRGGVKS